MKRSRLRFDRPDALVATGPRDDVRLLVSTPEGHAHAAFDDLPSLLRPGDLLVVNDSATLPASVPAGPYLVNVSTRFGAGLWVAEPRFDHATPGPVPIEPGDVLGGIRFVSPYPGLSRLWFVQGDLDHAMRTRGRPVRYGYVPDEVHLDAYQTMFARTPGSAEMPSAARPFTPAVVDTLSSRGVGLATVTLHTGVSSLEVDAEDVEDQPLAPEPFHVPQAAADAVNDARRVIAVGTTVARALESAVHGNRLRAVRGFSRHMVSPASPPEAFHGLLTGLHDPVTTHLALLVSLAGEDLVWSAYGEAVRERYLWHEFGDVHLILPRRGGLR